MAIKIDRVDKKSCLPRLTCQILEKLARMFRKGSQERYDKRRRDEVVHSSHSMPAVRRRKEGRQAGRQALVCLHIAASPKCCLKTFFLK